MSEAQFPCTSLKNLRVGGPRKEGSAQTPVADILDHSRERRIHIPECRACCMQEAQGRRVLL